MLDCLYQLVHVVLHALFRQVIRASFDCFVHVLLHELEDEGQSACRLIIKNLNELDDVRMRVEPLQCLDLSQIVHLVNAIEVAFHAFDRNVLPIAERLGLENLRESALA